MYLRDWFVRTRLVTRHKHINVLHNVHAENYDKLGRKMIFDRPINSMQQDFPPVNLRCLHTKWLGRFGGFVFKIRTIWRPTRPGSRFLSVMEGTQNFTFWVISLKAVARLLTEPLQSVLNLCELSSVRDKAIHLWRAIYRYRASERPQMELAIHSDVNDRQIVIVSAPRWPQNFLLAIAWFLITKHIWFDIWHTKRQLWS